MLAGRSQFTPALPHSSPRSDRVLVTVFALCIVTVAFGGQLVLAGMSEGYCVVWPSIGTRFAEGYSSSGFSRVERGMTEYEVVSLIGRPLSRQRGRPAPSGWFDWQQGDQTWQYGQDSSARGGDWAWLSREVVFRDGRVVQKVSWTYRD